MSFFEYVLSFVCVLTKLYLSDELTQKAINSSYFLSSSSPKTPTDQQLLYLTPHLFGRITPLLCSRTEVLREKYLNVLPNICI